MPSVSSYLLPSILSLLFHVLVALAITTRFLELDTTFTPQSEKQFVIANLVIKQPVKAKRQKQQQEAREAPKQAAPKQAQRLPTEVRSKSEPKPATKPKPKSLPDPAASAKETPKKVPQRKERPVPAQQQPEFLEIERQRMESEQALQEAVVEELQDEVDDSADYQDDQPFQVAVTDAEKALAYVQQIQRDIIQNWSRPPSARNEMKAILRVYLVPTGEVADVAIIESSGNEAFDRSAMLAVRKAERFEVPSDPQQFEKNFRQFSVLFKPDDLRY